MNLNIIRLTETMQQTGGGHILYCFTDMASYIDNAVAYIAAGLSQGEEILCIENERISPRIQSRLKEQLPGKLFKKVHFIDNFEFYCMRGDFHASTIVKYFSSLLEIFDRKHVTVRTWAHVEWGDQEEIEAKVNHLEEVADKKIAHSEIISLCAYDSAIISNKEPVAYCNGFCFGVHKCNLHCKT